MNQMNAGAAQKQASHHGYKQTELGLIPEDWEVVKLGSVGDVLIGLTYSPLQVKEDGVLVLRSSNVQNSKLCFEDNVFVDADIPEKIRVQLNDILICVRNGSRDLIGKSALLDERVVGMTFGAFMAVFRSSYAKYVFHHFQFEYISKQINEHLGATINQITNKSLNSFLISLPPTKAEQEAIAEALGDADALIESLEQLIAKKRYIKSRLLEDLVTGSKRLPKRSEQWLEKRLGSCATLKARIGWQGLTTSEYLDSGDYYLITGTEFKNGWI